VRICVIGTGYVGLVTGTVFADLGNDVICVDKIASKVDELKRGRLPIYEPGLEEMVRRNVHDGRLAFSTDTRESVERSLIVFICVNTPASSDGETDLSQVEAAAREIATGLNDYKIIVNKSTVPVGTGNLVHNILDRHKATGHGFDVVSNPEFLREGSAIQDALCPDRIVIGAPNKHVAMKLLELYATLERPVFITDVKSAEIIKYASNSFLATKVSFINSIADLCEQTGADIHMVVKGMASDRRIGGEFLQAGLGYGGSCFPKDIQSLICTLRRHGAGSELLDAVREINRQRVSRFLARLMLTLDGLRERRIGLLGLAFKPNTDDMREARSVPLVEGLLQAGASVAAYDPAAIDNARQIFGSRIEYGANPYEVAKGAHALLLVTEWREFKSLDMERIRDSMQRPVLFDGRNLYSAERKRRLGFEYYGVGIPDGVETKTT